MRAMAHGLEYAADVSLAVDRDDHNRTRAFRHDPARGLDAVHDRHDQVEQYAGDLATAVFEHLQTSRAVPGFDGPVGV